MWRFVCDQTEEKKSYLKKGEYIVSPTVNPEELTFKLKASGNSPSPTDI